VLGRLCLSDSSCESSNQHGREHGKDPSGQNVGDLKLLIDENDLIVYDGVKGCTCGINPESNSEGFDKPWSSVGDTVSDGVGNHSSACEPECGAEDTLVEVCEAADEDFWVDYEASDHSTSNADKEEDVQEEHECAESSETGKAIRNNRKSQSSSSSGHCESVPRKGEMLETFLQCMRPGRYAVVIIVVFLGWLCFDIDLLALVVVEATRVLFHIVVFVVEGARQLDHHWPGDLRIRHSVGES